MAVVSGSVPSNLNIMNGCNRRTYIKAGFGVGPSETIGWYVPEIGLKQMLACTAEHFDTGYKLNGGALVINCWEVSTGPQLETAGRINQKQTRPQDMPCPLADLPEDDRALIRSVLPEL